MTYSFLKGHGTENDFVLLPDHDGSVHGELDEARVRALCHRRAGIGGDGVLRVIRTAALPGDLAALGEGSEWFMDYRNADGSISEMCGNGVRVFALHLIEEGLVEADAPIPVGSRDGVKVVTRAVDGGLTVDMGRPQLLGHTEVSIDGRTWPARHVDMGNPHAVAFVDSLDSLGGAGTLLEAPGHDAAVFPDGVNVELVVRRGPRHVAMRVHERGSGETRSCGTGACAVMVAAAEADGAEVAAGGAGAGAAYRVDLPGGTLMIELSPEGRVLMTGPAVIVARGTTDL